MTIQWRRSTGDFVESRCGRWRITPIYGGLTRPESYEVRRDDQVVGSGSTQRECKELAEDKDQAPRSDGGVTPSTDLRGRPYWRTRAGGLYVERERFIDERGVVRVRLITERGGTKTARLDRLVPA